MTLLRDKSGANAVEYALIMALVAIFLAGAVILMSKELSVHFNSMANCLGDVINCSPEAF